MAGSLGDLDRRVLLPLIELGFFPLIVAVSFISSGALIVAALKTGGTGVKRYSLIVGIVVFVLTALVSFLKMSIT